MKNKTITDHNVGTKRKAKKHLCSGLALLLACVLCFSACGAAAEDGTEHTSAEAAEPAGIKTVDLMAGVRAQTVESRKADAAFRRSQYEYSLDLLNACIKAGNSGTMMVSPLSLELALAMAANGAEGESLEQLLGLFGAASLQELNETLHGLTERLGEECTAANSIWLRDGAAKPKQEFLQAAADYYNAEIYQAAFDEGTASDINSWAREKTKGMIDGIIDQIGPEDLVYLLNAVCFDAKWEVPYLDTDVFPGTFHTQDGTEQRTEMMLSTEYCYFSDDHAQGFMKDYENGRFKFAAIRPYDGIDLFDYLEETDGTALLKMLTEWKYERVLTRLPSFKTRSDLDMVRALQLLGVTAPFAKAEFPGIDGESGTSNSITGIRQKTFIDVDRQGTRAAAVTGMTTAAAEEEAQPHTVYLDRPFLYLILDGSSLLPVFMGIVTDPVADCGMP